MVQVHPDDPGYGTGQHGDDIALALVIEGAADGDDSVFDGYRPSVAVAVPGVLVESQRHFVADDGVSTQQGAQQIPPPHDADQVHAVHYRHRTHVVIEHQLDKIGGVGERWHADNGCGHDVAHQPGRILALVRFRPHMTAGVMSHPVAQQIDLADDTDHMIVLIENG